MIPHRSRFVVDCAVCGRPVDRLDMWYRYDKYCLVFVANCHGETEKMEIDMHILEEAPGNFLGGTAFARVKQLEAPR